MRKIFWILLFLTIFTPSIYIYFIKPFSIRGGNVGPYKERETVLTIDAKIYRLIFPLKKDDVIIFNKPGTGYITAVGIISGLPGEKTNNNTYDYDKKKIEGIIPENSFVITTNNYLNSNKPEVFNLINVSDIQRVAWFPIR